MFIATGTKIGAARDPRTQRSTMCLGPRTVRIGSWCIVIAGMLLCALSSPAQVITADLLGTVTDSNGAVISNAKVTIVNTDTQFTRTMNTTSAGDYSFTLLPPGTYTVRTEESGFKTQEESGIKLTAGDKLRVDLRLNPGAATETVTVNASSIPLLQTDTSTVQDVVPEKAVQDLPLNGRNLASAVQQAAGVNQASPNSEAQGNRADDRRPGFAYAANGQSDLSNNSLVDGLDNNEREQGFAGVRPSIDSIANVRILTNNYSADIGRTAGAVVDIITKAGTNEFHGSAYEYLRNNIFDAKDFFALTNPEYRQNVFGGSLGGPIIRNKMFFFGDIEANRTIQGQTQSGIVPTLYEEQHPGDFSDIGGPVVPQGQITTAGLTYFNMYPAPNRSGAVNYTSEFNKTQYAISTDDRIDYQFGSRDQAFVRFGYNPVSTHLPGLFPNVTIPGVSGSVSPGGNFGNGPSKTTATNVQANYVHTFSPNLILELKAGYTRINIATLPENYGKNLAASVGLVNTYMSSDSLGLPAMWMLFGDYSSFGDGLFVPILDVNNTFQYNGSMTYTRGSHNIKAGGAILRRQLNYLQDQWSPQGGFAFTPIGRYLFVPGASLANMLAGSAFFSERGDDLARQGLRSWEPSLYVQDDWHVRPWLTLNLGARWEGYTPISDAHNNYANFNLQTLSIQLAGKSTSSTGGVKTDYTDFSPRVGFEANLGHSTVIRGGFGFSYYPPVMQTQVQNPNPPFDYICFPCSTATFPNLPEPIASATNPSGTVSSLDPNLKNAYVRQYNLFVEKQFGANSISIGGVGENGRRTLYLRNADQPLPPGAEAPGTPPPALVYATQLPNVTNIQFVDNSGITNYYGFEVTYLRPTGHGLTISANYTWGHGLSNSVQSASTFSNPFSLVTNNPMYDYGNSPLDVRHRIAGSVLYDLPFGKTAHGFARQAIAGWEASLIGFWETGLPFTVENGSPQINLQNVNDDRPNQTGSAALSNPSISKFFNASVFVPQTFGTAGNERSDSVYGPRSRTLNAALLKQFPVYEKLNLQFRAEFFNITNTPNFAQPGANLSTPATFGVISATAANMNPRQMQFALRLQF